MTNVKKAESYLRAETSSSGLEVACSLTTNDAIHAPAIAAPDTTHISCAELEGTQPLLAVPDNAANFSRSVSPLPDSTNSRPISPSPVSPLVVAIDNGVASSSFRFSNEYTKLASLAIPPDAASLPHSSTSRDLEQRHLTGIASSRRARVATSTDSKNVLLYSTPDHMVLPARDRDSEFLENSNFQSTEARIQEIRALVTVFNQEWIERMTRSPRLLSRCAGLSTSMLFEKGMAALQQCFRGNMPETFLEVFGLIHVSCAIAYAFQREDDQPGWEGLFVDMFEWQYVLQKPSERQFFLEALDHLKRPKMPQSGWLKQLNPSHESTCEPLSMDIGEDVHTYLDDLQMCTFSDHVHLDNTYITDHGSLLQRLRKGRILRDCMTFLDGKKKILKSLG